MSEKPSFFPRLFAWAGGYIGCAAILSAILGIALGFGFGLLSAGGQARLQQLSEERDLLEPILVGDPAFASLKLLERSIGGYELIGVVPKQSDKDRLRERIIRAVGEKRADEIVRPVMVER